MTSHCFIFSINILSCSINIDSGTFGCSIGIKKIIAYHNPELEVSWNAGEREVQFIIGKARNSTSEYSFDTTLVGWSTKGSFGPTTFLSKAEMIIYILN